MLKTNIYRVIGDQKILVAVSIKDKNDNVILEEQFKDGELYKKVEMEYDGKGNVVKVIENEDGFETLSVYERDDEGSLVSSITKTLNDEIEKVEVVFSENEKTQTFYRHGVLAEKVVERETDDFDETIHYDVDGKITKRIVEEAYEDQTHTSVFDETNSLDQLQIEFFDQSDEMVEKRVFDKNKKLISLEKFEIENGLILSHYIQQKIEGGLLELNNKYQYDAQENETHHRIFTPEGKLLGLEQKKYDKENRMVEKKFENLSGIPSLGLSYHVVYEIEVS